MANSKNTIQNIPLEGELCMNSLKTEVKPFAGYNEKNTTFYGGTLSPIYDKTTELFDKNNSYTVFNSKGVPYTLKSSGELYKGTEQVQGFNNRYFFYSGQIEGAPADTVLVARCFNQGSTRVNQLYITSNKILLSNGEVIYERQPGDPVDSILGARAWYSNYNTIIVLKGENNCYWMCVVDPYNNFYRGKYRSDRSDVFISGYETLGSDTHSSTFTITFAGNVGVNTTFPEAHQYDIIVKALGGQPNFFDSYTSNSIPIEDFQNPNHVKWDVSKLNDFYSINLQPYAYRQITKTTNLTHNVTVYGYSDDAGRTVKHFTGINGYDVGCPLGIDYDSDWSLYYQGPDLISIGSHGRPISSCLDFGSNDFFLVSSIFSDHIYYKKNNGKWYYFYTLESSSREEVFKQSVIDNRYIIEASDSWSRVYDIETDTFSELASDWIISKPPLAYVPGWSGVEAEQISSTTSIVYASGWNAGYMINGSHFVGYLPNPFICTDFPASGFYTLELPSYGRSLKQIQNYYTTGDTVQSAKYVGHVGIYQNTIYPIDPNGNVVLPMSFGSQLIKGYSNNDLVKEGNTVYPLMYYNNTQKTYTYMLLSGMENITNAFSLQGQQYTVDDENIYAVSFNAGVLQNATAVAYKKNLTFLGTLPTQAVFWSDFNKTFYAFTGDRILSRMFEASDINKIEYVGQNPATLSLWICTDDGIYVLSDKDMFKLDYNSKQVTFYSKNAFIVTEGATNNECHAISLYLNDDERGDMIPVKLQTAYYGLGSEQKAVMDCWYLRLFDKDRTEGYVKVKVNTITDVTRHTEEKTFNISPSDYDDNNIFYLRYQPKYQECVAMQLELETNLGIYSMSLGVNTTDSTAQVSKFNF